MSQKREKKTIHQTDPLLTDGCPRGLKRILKLSQTVREATHQGKETLL